MKYHLTHFHQIIKSSIKMSNPTRFPPPDHIKRLPLLNQDQRTDSSDQIKLTDDIKNQFRIKVPLLAIKIKAEEISSLKSNPITKHAILAAKGLPSVRLDPLSNDQSHKLLLLNSSETENLPPTALAHFNQSGYEFRKFELDLDWSYYQAEEIIERLLPEELLSEVPSSFTMIGHIAHFNLRKEYIPYRHLIGEIILEKNIPIRTVVNKLDSINSQFRFFQMDLMAGEPDYQVSLSQAGCRFEFDFSKVYYNPRLSTEHTKLVTTYLKPHQILFDAFAGVGPFAIQAARNQSCFVIASDLNPSAVEALKQNVKLNRLNNLVRVGLGDARDRIRNGVIDLWKNPFFDPPPPQPKISRKQPTVASPTPQKIESSKEPRRLVSHFVMNLPELTLTFLDAYVDLYKPLSESFGDEFESEISKGSLPMVHAYCFTKSEEGIEAEKDICQRASESIKYEINSDSVKQFELSFVRKVAPHKTMYRLSFELPISVVLFSKYQT
ncbi:Met-10+ like-protein-domain-containing protein [Melampsora americana]|nr:Met-10+ like-protein-domain-containing protein [Melampsora americana]